MRIIPLTLLSLAGLLAAADPQPPVATEPVAPKPAVPQDPATAGSITALEAEISKLVGDQAKAAGPAAAAAAPDYNEAKAKVSAEIRRKLDMVEYVLADNDYARAIDGCNAILADHPHEPATTRLKYRILTAMVERERAQIERERAYRAEEALGDVQRTGVLPREPAKLARTVWVFEEDIQEADRQAVRRRLQERLTLNYDGVKVGEVLKPLFAVSGINYIILDKALSEDTLTLHLVDDTVENALQTIAKLVKVRYNYSANTVFIGADDSDVLVSEVIRLESGLTDVITDLQMPDPAGGTGSTGGASGSTGSVPRPPTQSGQQAQGGQAQGGQKSDLERFLDKVPDVVAGWPSEGRMYLERKSNSLYVRSTPSSIAELRRLLRALDYNSVQVLIEARFVTVSDSAMRQLGVDWGGGAQGKGVTIGGATEGLAPPSAISPATMGGTALGSSNLLAQILYNPSGSLGIKATLRALENDNKAESLAEPRILTVNNSLGMLSLLESVTYVDEFTLGSTTSDTSQLNNTTITQNTPSATPKYKTEQVGYSLKVRPSIARNSDTITLSLMPSVTQITGYDTLESVEYVPSVGEDPVSKTIQRPRFATRTLATNLHIRNGQTVVLGGLSLETVAESSNGVPGLRKVPVLGHLFQSQQRSSDRSNLLIFVTAHIIDPSGAKIGEEIRRLRDTAAVVMPEEIRLAEAEVKAVEVKRAAEAEAKTREATERTRTTPPPTRDGRR